MTIFAVVYDKRGGTIELLAPDAVYTDEGTANRRRDEYNADYGNAATRVVTLILITVQ